MSRTLRWGILGASSFARKQMVTALQMAPGGRLAALATSDPAKAAGFTALAPGLRVHHSYEALLADAEVDAIYIPLPNHLHVEWATKGRRGRQACALRKADRAERARHRPADRPA